MPFGLSKIKTWLNTEPKFFKDLIVHVDDEHPLDEPTPPPREPEADCEHTGQKYYLMFGEEICRDCYEWTGRFN